MGTHRLWLAVLLTLLEYAAATGAPDPCTTCPALPPLDCVGPDCVLGAPATSGTDGSLKNCKRLKCTGQEYFFTDLPIIRGKLQTLTCGNNGKWMDGSKEVNKGVCVKQFRCSAAHMRSSCAGVDPSSGCETMSDVRYTCSPKKLFYVAPDSTTWKEAADEAMQCNRATFTFTPDGVSFERGSLAVCATSLPTPLPRGTCATLPDSCSELTVADRTDFDCKQLQVGQAKPCAGGRLLYYKKNAATKWIEAHTMICDGAKWKIAYTSGTAAKKEDFDVVKDKAICAKYNPDERCATCSLLPKMECLSNEGCTPSENVFQDKIYPETADKKYAGCRMLTCRHGEHIMANNPPSNVPIDFLLCVENATTHALEWITNSNGAVTVTKALCVKDFECTTKSALNLECDGLGDVGCAKVIPNEDTPSPACPATSPNLYYKKAGGDWKDDQISKNVVCEKRTGVWTVGSVALIKDEQVICAASKPVSCLTGNTLKFDCADGAGRLDNGCEDVKPNDFGALECTTKTKKLFFQKSSGGAWDETTVECNAKTGKWKKSSAPNDVEDIARVVCADSAPSVKCDESKMTRSCADNAIKNIKVLNGECAIPPLQFDNALTCQTTAFPDIYYKSPTVYVKGTVQCDKKDGKWKTGEMVLAEGTNVICAKEDPNWVMCNTADLKYDCTAKGNAAAMCEKPTFSIDEPPVCPTPGPQNLYFKKGALSPWEQLPPIHCNKATGKWNEAGGAELPTPTNVICTDKDPGPLSCVRESPLKSDCGDAYPPSACDPVAPTDAGFSCSTGKHIYYKRGEAWKKSESTTCDKTTGKWKEQQSTSQILQKDDIVICAKGNPNEPKSSCPTKLRDTLCDGTIAAEFECEPVPPGDNPMCLNGKTLYFKKEPITATTKWMKATAINCVSNAWKIDYKYGKTDESNKDFDPNTDKIICALSNPDSKACSILSSAPNTGFDKKKYDFSVPTVQEPGKFAECPAPDPVAAPLPPGTPAPPPAPAPINAEQYEFFSTSKEEILGVNGPPVCSADGKWMDLTEGSEFGDSIGCRYKKCLRCTNNPIKLTTTLPSPPDVVFSSNGECARLTCPQNPIFAIKEVGELLLRFHRGEIKCEDDQTWKIGGNTISEIICVQKLFCYEDGFHRVDLDCPADVVGCTKAELDKETSGTYKETLKCAQGIMLFRNKTVQNWYPMKTTEIVCNQETGAWGDLVYIDEYNKDITTQLDYQHTIICAPANPMPWPTTTTTTTTAAPILPICEVCNATGVLPEAIGCDKCDRSHFQLSKLSEDECQMVSDSKDYKLVINSMEEVSILICKRDANPKWTKDGGTEAVVKVDARVEQKRDKLLPMAYGIIAAAIVAIGGMAIGCVMIFLKMRKQPSDRENKKKERGVTKKYTASNVSKTGGKSSKKSSAKSQANDGGTSKEATSKAESNLEDAPTLKL